MTNFYIMDIAVGFILMTAGFILIPTLAKKKNYRNINTYFCVAISIFYFLTILVSSFKLNRNNLQMVTPLSNVSPLLFTLSFVCIFLNDSIRNKLFKFMCLFNFFMLVAGFISASYALSMGANYFKFSIYDELAHLTYGVFAFYLLATDQVKLNKKDLVWSIIGMLGFVAIIFVINLVFNTSFFGLCLNDQYNIYGQKMFDNCHASNIVYVFSLVTVMAIGYGFTKLIKSESI